NLRDWHELYCAGHLIEAGVAYYEATGKTRLLDVVCRLADHIADVFGTKPAQLRGYDGHEEIELALVKLYRATGIRKYLELGRYFINERGRQPYFFETEAQQRGDLQIRKDFDYFQAHLPVREQQNAVGHSVRAMYLYAGMADIAAETEDEELLEACRALWKNVTGRQMYITGGIGSIAHREAFTIDYDLPNDYAYTETCASIGLVLFAHRMLQIEQDSRYADVIERCLYNGILSGVSLDGKSYFYVNPLAVWPAVCQHRSDKKHVKTERQPWYGTACCPPNIARLIGSLGQYFYSVSNSELYVHLYASGTMETEIAGQTIRINQRTEYPWQEQVEFSLSLDTEVSFSFALRIPDWCKNVSIQVNDHPVSLESNCSKGYAKINRVWSDGDHVRLKLEMPVERIYANPNVRENAGKVALQRGPVVYCLEEIDNEPNLPAISLPADAQLSVCFDDQLLGGIAVISGTASRTVSDLATLEEEVLYRSSPNPTVQFSFKAIPYFAWCNRNPGEMIVWIRE
ncbi:MAG: hypothetical protein JWN30_2603, partial [Bacilli bacterium]|nr:hypothetical protein [Bacilli bacterium]